ncbi:MAG TPA: hypothetical protein VN982_12700 [Candidatus Dormibacteraeota bacterium]|nr:hypothetical protein [Candidatus Dormibacteraeota bacterium]
MSQSDGLQSSPETFADGALEPYCAMLHTVYHAASLLLTTCKKLRYRS